MHIREFAKRTGVSVRTLHYYDEIDLLKPAWVDEENGYRHYDQAALMRMQEILFFRELGFSLKSICELLALPEYDRKAALQGQKALLILKKERLESMILAIDDAVNGVDVMNVFDQTEYENTRRRYETEVREKWGNTRAYQEYADRAKGSTKDQHRQWGEEMMGIFADFAACMQRGAQADAAESQALVRRLQEHITDHYYTCTKEILAGLGQMYAGDERFRGNIDQNGEGTAFFVRDAIMHYCKES